MCGPPAGGPCSDCDGTRASSLPGSPENGFLATREFYQALRAYVREWTLAKRTCDDLGRDTTPDTSVQMDIGQVKGTKGKGKKGKKGKGKEKVKGKKDNSEPKGNTWTDDSNFAGECRCCGKWGHKKAQCRKQNKDQGSKPPAEERRLNLDIRRERIEWTKNTCARRTSHQLLLLDWPRVACVMMHRDTRLKLNARGLCA